MKTQILQTKLIRSITVFFVLLATFAVLRTARAQYYQAGNIVQHFTLTNRTTRLPVKLSDFAGNIVLLEWFAWWCPYCQADAPLLKSQIDDYYAARHGNAAGLPVLHVGINLQGGQEVQTSNFIAHAGLTLVLEDFNRIVANRFQSADQPIYAIINCVSNSPNTQPYQLLLHLNGHGNNSLDTTPFKTAIDSVRAPFVTPTLAGARATNGLFTFSVNGPSNQNYLVQVSSNLATWATLTNVFGSNMPTVVKDNLSLQVHARFYRTLVN